MTTANPVNTSSYYANQIINDLEIHTLLEKLEKMDEETKKEDAQIMAAIFAILSQLETMLNSKTPPSSGEISEITSSISALMSLMKASSEFQNDGRDNLESIKSSTTMLSKQDTDPATAQEISLLKNLCKQIAQQLTQEKKQVQDLLSKVETTLASMGKSSTTTIPKSF